MKLFIYVEHNNRNPIVLLRDNQTNPRIAWNDVCWAREIVSEEEINGKLVMKIVALLAIYLDIIYPFLPFLRPLWE